VNEGRATRCWGGSVGCACVPEACCVADCGGAAWCQRSMCDVTGCGRRSPTSRRLFVVVGGSLFDYYNCLVQWSLARIKRVVTTTIRLRFDCNSTALWPLDDPRHDRTAELRSKWVSVTATSRSAARVTSLWP